VSIDGQARRKTYYGAAGEETVATAAPAGEQCLKEADAGKSNACLNSVTSCQALHASNRLI
jgi:hypothetical protein